MMFESITKNKVKTFFIITFFIIFVMALVYFISLWLFEDSYMAVAFALLYLLFPLWYHILLVIKWFYP